MVGDENIVQCYLREKGYLYNDALNIIKCKNLITYLKGEGHQLISDEISTKLDFLFALAANQILDNASVHFWFLVNQFYSSDLTKPENVKSIFLDLQIAVLDSFHDFLPSSFFVDVHNEILRDLYFQKLGFVLSAPTIRLDKASLFSGRDKLVTAKSNQAGLVYTEIARLDRHKNFYVIDDLSLYYRDDKVIDVKTQKQQFAHDLSKAMDQLAIFDQDLKTLIDLKLEYIVLIPKGTRLSFTDSRLPKTIFIGYESYNGDLFSLAATIVHEFSHLEFAAYLNCVKFAVDDNKLYYSPWRSDSRPLHGLIHGIYVFTAVFRFLSISRHKLSPVAAEMRTLIYHQLKISHLQLNQIETFTASGRTVIDDLNNILMQFSQDPVKDSAVPHYVTSHRLHYSQIES